MECYIIVKFDIKNLNHNKKKRERKQQLFVYDVEHRSTVLVFLKIKYYFIIFGMNVQIKIMLMKLLVSF